MNIVILQPLAINSEKLKEYTQILKENGHNTIFYDTNPTSEEEAIKRTKDTDILMIVNYPISPKIIQSCPKLKMISIAFTGFDHVDSTMCKQKNIVVCNAAQYSTNSVAELTFGLIISVIRTIVSCDKITRVGGTRQSLIGNELYGKTLGIIGTGAIGLRVAEIGHAFGCRLLGYSRTKKPVADDLGLKYTDLVTLLKESDIITVHVPLNEKTKNLISTTEISLMKKSAIVIQTSRGGTINEEALANALNSGQVAGAGIDVFVQEPPVDLTNSLLKAKNTVLTPHVAFATIEALTRRADIAFENINKWLSNDIQNRVI